jgi:probable rRNA maturation factor
MSINYYCENVRKPILRYRLISCWLKDILKQSNRSPGSITYIFCDDNYLLDINRKFLNHENFTDIITFDYIEGNKFSGDIFISIERVADNSVKYGVILEEEFLRVMVHGILHLLGYNDYRRDEKEIMRKLESDYISLYKRLENDSSFKV